MLWYGMKQYVQRGVEETHSDYAGEELDICLLALYEIGQWTIFPSLVDRGGDGGRGCWGQGNVEG